MEWKRIWHTDWSLWSRLGARIGWFDDDRWRWCIPLLPPHRHTRTFVRAYTRPLPRVTRVSALVVVVVDDGVCGDRLTRRPWDVDPQPRPMGSLLQHDLQRNFVVGHRPRFNQSTCEQQQRHLLVHWWIVNITVGKSFSVGASPVRPSWKRTHGDRSSTNVNRATKRCTPHHWLGPLLACAADTDSAGPYVEPTTALRRGRRRRPPCLPIRRHPGK